MKTEIFNKENFFECGYALLEESIPTEILNRFRNIADEIEAKALEYYKQGDTLSGACVIEDSVGPRLMRFDDLHFHYTDDLNRLLATPVFLKLIKELCGPTAIILQADILYKHQHPHPVVKWHQGAPNDPNHAYLNIGIYLDDSDLNDGCLRYVPATHTELQDIESIERDYGWNPPNVVQVPAKAGNVMVQEMMVLHSSEPKRSPGARRTIYVEVRPYAATLEDGKQDEHWIELRRLWMGEILKNDIEGVFTDKEKAFFGGNASLSAHELMKEITEHRCPPIPAVYNYKPTKGPDYPIPADLVAY